MRLLKAIFKFFGIKILADVEDAEYDPGEDRFGMGRMYDTVRDPDEDPDDLDWEHREPIVGSFEDIFGVLNTIDALYSEELHRPNGADNTGRAVLLRESLLNDWTATDMRRWLRDSEEWSQRHMSVAVQSFNSDFRSSMALPVLSAPWERCSSSL